MGKDGFEPPNSEEDRFTVCCRWPLGYLPIENNQIPSDSPTENLQIGLGILNQWSHLPESNWRPTDYKSVALPAELRWQVSTSPAQTGFRTPGSIFSNPPELVKQGGLSNKELPPNFGKAKVREFRYCKNFEREFYLENQEIKKTPKGLIIFFRRLVFAFFVLSG